MNTKNRPTIKEILGNREIKTRIPEGGTNNRTTIIEIEGQEYVLRKEDIGGFQLRRAFNAQTLAKKMGVDVANIVAHNFDYKEKYYWTVEEKIAGDHFYPDRMSEAESKSACIDLGRQFKLMHTVECDRFGLLPPYPYKTYQEWEDHKPEEVKKSEELTGPVFKSFADYSNYRINRLKQACQAANLDSKYIDKVKIIFAQYDYQGTPRFCGGDTRTSNVLTSKGKIEAIIDWEWAYGGDPASHVGAWSAWNNDIKYLDYFLEGYQPDDIESFRTKIVSYEISDIVNSILAYNDLNDQKSIDEMKTKLEKLIDERY